MGQIYKTGKHDPNQLNRWVGFSFLSQIMYIETKLKDDEFSNFNFFFEIKNRKLKIFIF